jgi:hypothetical protein
MQITRRLWTLIGLLVAYLLHDLAEKNIESLWTALGLDKLVTEGVPQGIREAVMQLTASYVNPIISYFTNPLSFMDVSFWRGLIVGAIIFSLPDLWTIFKKRRRHSKAWQSFGLYIAHMEIGIEKLESEFALRLFISGFNASGTSASIDEIRGNIGFRSKMVSWADGDIPLPRPSLESVNSSPKSIQNFGHIVVTLKQSFPRELVPHLLASLDAGEKPYFEFRHLDLMARSDDAPECQERLPIWHGVSLLRAADRVISIRSSVSTPSGVGPSSSSTPSPA